MEKYLYTALFAPLISSLFVAFFAARPKMLFTGIVASLLIAISMIASFILLIDVNTYGPLHVTMMDWIAAGNLEIPFGFVVDEVSVIMMVTVTLVSTIVHIYSIGYMDHDKSFNRFFSYLSAFVFSMMILVMSDNFVGLFIGWEGVGLCSWLLIGFWYHKHSASWAANEAFIMNRIADLGMLMGLFLIYWNVGSFQYDDVFASVKGMDPVLLATIGIFLFIGAMGKSAQFPLHTWLADAMEGPTPVSALIHAATMVTAGVYLVIRCGELYSLIPEVGFAIASLGAFVAVFAASMALVNNDLKRIIAYSTLSQLGYMFVAAGLGAYWIALFHLMTHAFFKSLLFLGAGNVMHAMHDELNIKKMGGLYGSMKATAILMSVASVALAGIYPFAGFFSKDKILEVAFSEGAYFLWFALFIGAGLTAFYSFRLVMLVFFGEKEYVKYGVHPHEAQPFVIYALLPLGLLAVIAGFFEHTFEGFVTRLLAQYEIHIEHGTEALLIAGTLGIAISGISFAVFMYRRGGFSKSWEESMGYKLLSNQYYIPKLYELYIMRPFTSLARFAWLKIDTKIVDFTVDLIARIVYSTGQNARKMQSGNLSDMLRWMIVGMIVLLALAIFYRPMV
ncbi:NADH-quinone oxidoreductase subunit L [Sulfurospirillum sp.]|uniref:NADH-quinone oxidoreductase subunit L n=1 Tax=Sulfurospirillum sp. TaxID=2053622 RepID=UPI002FDCE8F8